MRFNYNNVTAIEFYGACSDISAKENEKIMSECTIANKKEIHKLLKKFNYEEFYDWVRNMNNKGHEIFISEYSMPNDFKIIWEQEVKSSLSANNISGGNKTSIERLFVLK